MRLSDWIEKQGLRRYQAAEALGVSAARVTFLCSPEGWPATKHLAEKIRDYTAGDVTPNDFLTGAPPAPHPEAPANG